MPPTALSRLAAEVAAFGPVEYRIGNIAHGIYDVCAAASPAANPKRNTCTTALFQYQNPGDIVPRFMLFSRHSPATSL